MNITRAPIIQQQELTWKCNNNCSFCYNPERCIENFQPRKGDMQQNIDIAQASVKRGVMAICLTGGEPFLLGEHFFDVFSIYKDACCYTSINSNGRLITDKIANRLLQMGLHSALISIHGIGELHDSMVGIRGAFQETLNGIKKLQGNGISVTPNFVATAHNIHGLREVGELLASIGIHSMTVTPFLPSWGSEPHALYVLQRDHYRKFFETIRQIRSLGIKIDSTLPIAPCTLIRFFPDEWEKFLDVHSARVCMAGRSFGVVSPDGNFRACIQAPFFPDYGGAMLSHYTKSWRLANNWSDPALLPDICRNCHALDVCGGGCRTSCLWENQGSPRGATMYIGEPLSKEQAAPFKNRAVHDVTVESTENYIFRSGIKFRDEGWGLIIFNPNNQSFTVLSKSAAHFLPHSGTITITTEKVKKVLLAIQAIEPAQKRQDAKELTATITILSGNKLLPRLAKNLTGEAIYCLRADTGERYFF